jgi:uncharacterized protein (DUF433 family)
MDKLTKVKVISGVDRREIPIYTPAEVAYYLSIRESTLRTWIVGRHYPTRSGKKFFEPIIKPADPQLRLLSFYNLGEAHVLASTRYDYDVPLRAIRKAVAYLRDTYPSPHPLLSREFFTNGLDIFVKTIEDTINLTKGGQFALKPIIDLYLQNIARDDRFNPTKVYPVIRGMPSDKVISITSGVSSSRPVIDGTGVPVIIVWQRHKAGEDDDTLADDFDIPVSKIRRAIEYVKHIQPAA